MKCYTLSYVFPKIWYKLANIQLYIILWKHLKICTKQYVVIHPIREIYTEIELTDQSIKYSHIFFSCYFGLYYFFKGNRIYIAELSEFCYDEYCICTLHSINTLRIALKCVFLHHQTNLFINSILLPHNYFLRVIKQISEFKSALFPPFKF